MDSLLARQIAVCRYVSFLATRSHKQNKNSEAHSFCEFCASLWLKIRGLQNFSMRTTPLLLDGEH
jgi:hypothetical protein